MSEPQVYTETLPHGLKLIGEVNPSNKSAALGFFVKTGARDEVGPESGVSHFLEHMMFKGTPKRSALQITYDLGNIGAQANAFTSEENTVYYASVVPRYFAQMQELLCDMLRPALDPEEFNTEKKVILEEIALYQDRPHFYLFEKALSDYFASHPAGNSVLGSTQSISAVSRDQMKSYFDRRYSPSNMILVAAGNFDWQAFVNDAKTYSVNWQNFKTERQVQRYPGNKIVQEYRKKNIQQSHVLLISNGPSAQDAERFAFMVLASILGDSSGSKIYWELVEKGLVESAGADSDERDGTGCFMLYASTEPDKLEKASTILKNILAGAAQFSEGELQRAKTKICSKIALGSELPFNRLLSLGSEWTYNQRIHSPKDSIARVKAVDRAAIERALSTFSLKEVSEFRLLPE